MESKEDKRRRTGGKKEWRTGADKGRGVKGSLEETAVHL